MSPHKTESALFSGYFDSTEIPTVDKLKHVRLLLELRLHFEGREAGKPSTLSGSKAKLRHSHWSAVRAALRKSPPGPAFLTGPFPPGTQPSFLRPRGHQQP